MSTKENPNESSPTDRESESEKLALLRELHNAKQLDSTYRLETKALDASRMVFKAAVEQSPDIYADSIQAEMMEITCDEAEHALASLSVVFVQGRLDHATSIMANKKEREIVGALLMTMAGFLRDAPPLSRISVVHAWSHMIQLAAAAAHDSAKDAAVKAPTSKVSH